MARPEFALTNALMGHVEYASQIVAATMPSPSPSLHLASAVVAAREGRFGEAQTILDGVALQEGRHGEVETLMGPSGTVNFGSYQRAFVEALRDWSRLELGKTPSPVDHRVQLFGDGGPGSLPKHWPELVAAMDRLALEGAQATAPSAAPPRL